MVGWLERQDCDRHGLGSEPTKPHSVVSLEKTLKGTFRCLVILASIFKLKSYLYEFNVPINSSSLTDGLVKILIFSADDENFL